MVPENKMKKGCPKRKNSAVLALLRPGGKYQDNGDLFLLTNKFEKNINPVRNKGQIMLKGMGYSRLGNGAVYKSDGGFLMIAVK